MRALLVMSLVGLVRTAAAAPAADVVTFWAADGAASWRDEARTAATRAGAAFVDRSPAAAPRPAAPALLDEGTRAYLALRFDDAVAALDRAAAEVDETGAAGLSGAQLADLFLFRGLARVQRADPAAWDDLVIAARLDPARVLDPARFPPRAVEQLQRAQRAVAAEPRAPLTVALPASCAATIDGARIGDAADPMRIVVELVPGAHWVRVECPDRTPWGRRVLLSAPGVAVEATPALIAAPSADEALIQARISGASTVVDVTVAGGVARARLRRVSDGRELERVNLALDRAAPGALAEAVAALLAPAIARPPTRWYRSRWVWAAGGALVAAAILVPIALSGDGGEPDLVVRPTGWPPW